MARTNHFLTIQSPQIKGESQGHGSEFVGAIDVSGWSWKVSNDADKPKPPPSSTTIGGTPAPALAPTTGKQLGVVSDVITFHKVVDKSTIRLIQAMNNCEILNGVTFVVVEYSLDDDGSSSDAFRLNVKLKDARVKSYALSSSSSEYRVELEETWELEYTKITFDYPTVGVIDTFFDRVPGSEPGSPPDLKQMVASQMKQQLGQSQSQSQPSRVPDPKSTGRGRR